MNEPREFYLVKYGDIDTVDRLLAKGIFFYCCWKYWHSPVNHAKSLATVAAYHMYLECASGAVDPDWKLEEKKIMSFRQWKLRQSEQACQYRPRQRKYPGDEMCRDATTENRKRRKSPSASGGDQYIVQADILAARSSAGAGRLCSHDFQELRKHMNSVERKGGTKTKGTRPSKCAACGKDTYFMCMLCDKPVCFRGSKGCETWDCIMDLHDEECFGLLRCDATVAKNWKKPSARQRLRHADYVQNIMN